MYVYIYGFQYGTFSAIVFGGQLQKNVLQCLVFSGAGLHIWQVFRASFPASSKIIVCSKKSLQYMFRSFFSKLFSNYSFNKT